MASSIDLFSIFLDVCKDLIVLALFSPLAYLAKIFYENKLQDKHRNKIVFHLKKNDYIKETFRNINRTSFLKFFSFYCIYVGALLSVLYFQLYLNLTGYLVYLLSSSDFLAEHIFPYVNSVLLTKKEFFFGINEWTIISIFFNFAIVPLMIVSIFFLKKSISQHLKDGSTKLADSLIIYSISVSFLIGAILMINIFIHILSYLYLVKDDQTIISQEENIFYFFEASKTLIQHYWENSLYAYFIGSALSFFMCIALFYKFDLIVREARNKIITFNLANYPEIIIKKQSGEIKGKIKNVFDKDFIEVYDNNIKKITTWKNIEVLEIERENGDD